MTEIELWSGKIPFLSQCDEDCGITKPYMEYYPVKSWYPLPTVVIFPGGGYYELAEHEAEPIARFYNSCGFNAFVVYYRVCKKHFPEALSDAQRAIKLIKSRASEFRVDKERLFTVGFSAGGHLNGCLITMPDYSNINDELDGISARPSGAVFGYPLLKAEGVNGDNAYECLKSLVEQTKYSLSDVDILSHVDESTPPCFVWHTVTDCTVNVGHSLRFAEKLSEKGVSVELKVYGHGPHGLGLALHYNDVSEWAGESVRWMNDTFLRLMTKKENI